MIAPFSHDPRPIGVFDSGVGGLTVLKALMSAMPGESFIYLGDTARLPYGTKSAEKVRRYSQALAQFLLAEQVKMIVIACNTASVHATEMVTKLAAPIPVIGMVEPATAAAIKATQNKNILVMATQSTTRTLCYPAALQAALPLVKVAGVPCQVLVALAEEGWTDGAEARAVVERYLRPYFADDATEKPDTIILGCTHFPLLKDVIADVVGPHVALIDSGRAAADFITRSYPAHAVGHQPRRVKFYVTDAVGPFKPVAEKFLQAPVEEISQLDLTDFADKNKPSPPWERVGRGSLHIQK